MLGYVIQEHRCQGQTPHWDFMLEQGRVLKTFRLDLSPDQIVLGRRCTAVPIFDHDKRFLTYEGSVQQGLGRIRIVDRGTYEGALRPGGPWDLSLKGDVLNGPFRLTALDGGVWSLERPRLDEVPGQN